MMRKIKGKTSLNLILEQIFKKVHSTHRVVIIKGLVMQISKSLKVSFNKDKNKKKGNSFKSKLNKCKNNLLNFSANSSKIVKIMKNPKNKKRHSIKETNKNKTYKDKSEDMNNNERQN